MMWYIEFTKPFTLTCGGKPVLWSDFEEDGVHVTCLTHSDRKYAVWLEGMKDFTFRLFSPEKGSLRLERRNASLRLYCNGKLTDEDWLVGEIPAFDSEEGIVPVDSFPEDAGFDLTNYNANIGDCMPFSYKDEYRLFALFDRRHHGSKAGLGAHQWMQRSTSDLVHWQDHSIAVGIDEEWEGSICTGSLIEHEGKVYAFYAARMTDGSPARLTYAVSEDCEHFKKSGKYLSLAYPYEPTSARDPKVFRDEDGLFHMLVTSTYLPTNCGCLAHLISENLTDWQQQEPFFVCGDESQPECSDYFKMGDLYYLVGSHHLNAEYFVSEKPCGPWRRLKESILDPCLCVPKTAMLGDRRLVSGWIPTGHWGGFTITRELIQHSDGTLGTRIIDLPGVKTVSVTEKETGLDGDEVCARLTLEPETENLRYRITVRDGEARCAVEFDTASLTATLIENGQCPQTAPAIHRVPAPYCEGRFEMKLYLHKDSVEFALPDDRCFVTRRYGKGSCTVTVCAENGKVGIL